MMKKNKIFIACDSTNILKIKKIIKESQNKKIQVGYKFGLEFLNSKSGRSFLPKLKNKIVFADLKIHDIPNTCIVFDQSTCFYEGDIQVLSEIAELNNISDLDPLIPFSFVISVKLLKMFSFMLNLSSNSAADLYLFSSFLCAST